MRCGDDNSKPVAFLSMFIVWLFYFYGYVTRSEPSVLVNDLYTDFGMTPAMIGFVVSVLYIPYVALQIPCGLITDKIGVKRMVVIGALLSAAGTFLFGSATSVIQLQAGRFLIGIAVASAFLCCGKIASDYFSPRKYSMLMGITMCMGCLGGISGTAPTAYFVSKIGWRSATFIISCIGVLIAILAVFSLMGSKEKKSDKKKADILGGLKIIAKKPKAWLLGFYGSITYLPLSAFAELWSTPFVEKKYNLSTTAASASSIVIFVGFAIGGVISAWIAEKINDYKKTIIYFAIGVTIIFPLAIYVDMPYCVCITLLFLGGVLAGANTLAFTVAASLVPKECSATSTGFLNAIVMSSGIVFQPLLGKILDFCRNGLVDESGTAIYTVEAYRGAFLVVIICMVFATISTFYIDNVRYEKE